MSGPKARPALVRDWSSLIKSASRLKYMHVSIAAEQILAIGGFPITNSLLTSFLVSSILVLVALLISMTVKLMPEKFQNLVEAVIEPLYDLVTEVSRGRAKQFFPLIATLFLFILVANWSGLLPGVGSVGLKHYDYLTDHQEFIPLFRAGTADLNTTIALALVAVGTIQYYGIKSLGLKSHLQKFFNFSGPMPFFVGILEFISEMAKIISFSFRLFGNIFAGEVLLVVITSLVPIIAPLPFFGLELFVGLIQALVFAMLTLVFVNIATVAHAESY